MCHFVLAAVPRDANLEEVRAIAKKHMRPLSDPSIAFAGAGPQRPADLYYTTKHCNCGTAIGAGADRSQAWRPSDKELRKLRRKGWSEAKIARWVAEHERTDARRKAKELALEHRSQPEVESWLALAAEVLASGAANRFGILLVWSPGASIELEDEIRTPIDEASSSLLFEAREGVLYNLLPSHPGGYGV